MAIRSRKYYYRIPCFACCSSCQIRKGEGGGEDLWRPNAIFMPTLWGCAVYHLKKGSNKMKYSIVGYECKAKAFWASSFPSESVAVVLFCIQCKPKKQQGKQYTRQHCLLQYEPSSHQPYIRESGAFAERVYYMGGQHHFLGCPREITYSESTTYWYSICTQCCDGKHDAKIYPNKWRFGSRLLLFCRPYCWIWK